MNDRIDQRRTPAYSRGLHALAVVTAFSVFPLIFVGAGVTSKGAGMAYADGFTSNGYLLQNPPGWWSADDTRWEHGHRLLGRTVGVLSILLAIACWRQGGLVRSAGLVNLFAIIVQGTLGALRVYEVSTFLAMVHGIFGQLCFCVAAGVALVTGRTWLDGGARCEVDAATFLRRLFGAGTVAVLLQLVSGATYRHFHTSPALFVHVFLAVAVAMLVGWMAMWATGLRSVPPLLRRLGLLTGALMAVQLLLGGSAFLVLVMGGRWSPFVVWAIPSAHVAVGALLLATSALLTGLSFHLLIPSTHVRSEAVTASATAS